MSEMVQISTSTLNAPSESSVGNHSSLWSVSTISNIVQGYSCTIIENDNSNAQGGKCWPILKLMQSIFRWKKFGDPDPVDKSKLLADLTGYIELIGNFFKLYLTPKLEAYSEQCYLSKEYRNLCLPAAQVWAAAYLLNLYMEPFNNKESDNTQFINSNNFRRLLISLYWEMEVSKKTAYKFYTRFQKFSKDLNSEFQKLKTTFLSASRSKATKLDFVIRDNLKLNLKKDQSLVILDENPSSQEKFIFSLSIDTENVVGGGGVPLKNQDFSKLKCEVQEEIITNLLTGSVESLETCHDLLECSKKRIGSRGIIKKDESKNVTCYSALKSVTSLISELTTAKLEEDEMSHLAKPISNLFDKWNEYVGYAQGVILNFYELSDMITICYCFIFHYIKINIPTLMEIQKEVDVKSKFQKKCEKFRSKQLNLKQYAVESLLQESNERCKSRCNIIETTRSSSLKTSLLKEKTNYDYQKVMLSTRYPLVIQEHPLQVLNKNGGNYSIIVRPRPDFERIDSDMILLECTSLIANNQKQATHLLDNTESLKSLQLDTFKKLEIQLLNEIS